MKKTAILFSAFVVILAVFVGIKFIKNNTEEEAAETPPIEIARPRAWVEVLSGNVFLLKAKSATSTDFAKEKEVFTGDEIEVSSWLETSAQGKVLVHFEDGSVMRGDAGSRFSLSGYDYDKTTGKLVVVAKLDKGNLWSKIIELATPDSLWQVETGNAVATVRGSAFGVYSDGKNSKIFGSQHQVAVSLVDPDTRKVLKKDIAIVDEGKELNIEEKEVKELARVISEGSSAGPAATSERKAQVAKIERSFVPVEISVDTKKQDWFRGNEEEDNKIEADIKEAKEGIKDDKAGFRKILREKAENRFEEIKKNKERGNIIKENDISVKKDNAMPKENEVSTLKNIESKKQPADAGTKKIIEKTAEEVGSVSSDPFQIKIVTESDRDLSEGEMVLFRSMLYGGGVSEKDVTAYAKWNVLGGIGSFAKPGTLFVKLDQSVAELGEAYGFVVATYTTPDGKELLGKSDQIHVEAKVEPAASDELFIGQ